VLRLGSALADISRSIGDQALIMQPILYSPHTGVARFWSESDMVSRRLQAWLHLFTKVKSTGP
jgi:hypothetical protein